MNELNKRNVLKWTSETGSFVECSDKRPLPHRVIVKINYLAWHIVNAAIINIVML